ncbi:hypothetical protein BYT27DRAFT_7338789 [Phlegmacium glaucopus]|nr:hypothetical protein BYT27DRAFT_7338789 [Phlegmacium glaucopus]
MIRGAHYKYWPPPAPMPALKSAFLSLLLLTVASCVPVGGNTTTITLFRVEPSPITSPPNPNMEQATVTGMSAIGVGTNGGTTYVEGEILTGVELVLPGTSPVTTHITEVLTKTFVEAASWFYVTASLVSGSIEVNCTLGTNDATSECIEIDRAVQIGNPTTTQSATVTRTYPGLVTPVYTLTVTGPIPTSTSAATILGSPIFSNRLSGVVLGLFFLLMLVLEF